MDKMKICSLVGTEFVNGGRNRDTGLDCWGLVMVVYEMCGIAIPDFTVDAFAFQAIDALAGMEAESRSWEEVYRPREADVPLVVLMRMHPRLITHAGVLIGGNRIIHTTKSTGAIVSRATALQSRITGYYRHV